MSEDKNGTHDQIRVPEFPEWFETDANELIGCADLIHVGREASGHQNDEAGCGDLVLRERGKQCEKIETDESGGMSSFWQQVHIAAQNGKHIESDAREEQ